MLSSVSIGEMETIGEVCSQERLQRTVVLPSNPTLRWKREFFNYLLFINEL